MVILLILVMILHMYLCLLSARHHHHRIRLVFSTAFIPRPAPTSPWTASTATTAVTSASCPTGCTKCWWWQWLSTTDFQADYSIPHSWLRTHEHGLIRRIQPAGLAARYEDRVDNHYHLVCRDCGSLVDTDCAKGRAPCLDAEDNHGYRIDEAEVIYWGLCPDCQSKAKS